MIRLVRVTLAVLTSFSLLVPAAASAAPAVGSPTIQPYTKVTGAKSLIAKRRLPTSPIVSPTPAPAPAPTTTPVAPAPTPTPAPGRWFGYYVPGVPTSLTDLNTLEGKVGKNAAVVNFFIADTESFPQGRIDNVVANGSIPMVTMEFWSAQNGVSTITNGAKDSYLRTWAQKAKAHGKTIYLRPFHEMNGDWYPWNGTVNGNTPAQVVAAWRHVKQIFAAEGATNVKFVWCVNNDSVPATTANKASAYWPGDAYVDYLSIDGYNWGNTRTWSSWKSFSSVIGPTYNEIKVLSAKPMIIGETGCAEQGGDKAAWIAGMFSSIKTTYTRIEGVCWFNANKENDWRVESSAAALTATKNGLAAGF